MTDWIPKEIIVHETVKDDPVTTELLKRCPGTPVKYVTSGTAKRISDASETLNQAGSGMLDKMIAGKQVVYVAPATNVVDIYMHLTRKYMLIWKKTKPEDLPDVLQNEITLYDYNRT